MKNPDKPHSLTSASRKKADKTVFSAVEKIGGEGYDANLDESTYGFSKGTTRKNVLETICNSLRENGFSAEIEKGCVYVDDPKDSYKTIAYHVYNDKEYSEPGKAFFTVRTEHGY